MSRSHPVRSVKICKICGEGYDAFKSWDARGRYCSPACLAEARRRHRESGPVEAAAPDEPRIGPATLPPAFNLGNPRSIVVLDGEDRSLV
jgi:hypothetical protein